MTMLKTTPIYIQHVGWLDYPEDDDVVVFLREGWFEYRETAFVWLYLRPNDVVVDCGAHAGLYTVTAARMLEGSGRVIAVEPNPHTARLLRANLAKNEVENATVVEAAVYRKSGTVRFHLMRPGKAAYDSLYVANESEAVREIDVPAVTLDEVLNREKIGRVDFLKLDIEGAEVDALAGARAAIEEGRLPLIMVEFTESNLQASGHSTENLRSTFEAASYRLFRFNEKSLKLEDYPFDGPIWYENLFACFDPGPVNKRLRDAPERAKRIAKELILRGGTAQRLRETAERSHRSELQAQEKIQQLDQAEAKARDQLRRSELQAQEKIQQLDQAEAIARERLMLLRHSHLQNQMAERRINDYLLVRWPLRLAFKYGLARRPPWLLARQGANQLDELVARYIADNPLQPETSARGAPTTAGKPHVSVVLCTYNPRADLLAWSLESIARQTMDPTQYEVILVDNNSMPPIDLSNFPIARMMPLRQVSEKRQGLIFARLAGIKASSGNLIVFIDDDNYLEPHYLERALEIADQEPEIGLFGGISHGRFERKMPRWKRKLMPYLGVRDNGPEPITSFEEHWGAWEPIGAGMVSRRDVADAYAEFVKNNPASGGLGRQGSALLSCEDSLFARVANRQGYACSYQPLLGLEHYIPKGRLSSRYLFRLLLGMGRSYVRLERVLGRDENIQPLDFKRISARFAIRFARDGITGIFRWAWDLGYQAEAAKRSKK